jgi:hypothetical protein
MNPVLPHPFFRRERDKLFSDNVKNELLLAFLFYSEMVFAKVDSHFMCVWGSVRVCWEQSKECHGSANFPIYLK